MFTFVGVGYAARGGTYPPNTLTPPPETSTSTYTQQQDEDAPRIVTTGLNDATDGDGGVLDIEYRRRRWLRCVPLYMCTPPRPVWPNRFTNSKPST